MSDITFAEDAFEEYISWQLEDKTTLKKINALFKVIQRNPFSDEGKPESLKGNHTGKWSRRINEKDRFVYQIEDGRVIVFQCKGHYEEK